MLTACLSGTSEWESLGGDMASQPGATSMADGRVEVVSHANNDTIQVKSYNDGAWNQSWTVIGLKTTSPPAVVGCRGGYVELDILVRGVSFETQRQYWHSETYAGSFAPTQSSWEYHGGGSASTPAWGCSPYRLAVFGYSGTNHPLYIKSWDGRWGDWELIGGNFRGDPVIASRTDQESLTFGVAVNGTLEYYHWTPEVATAPAKLETLGGSFHTVPNVLVTGPDRLDVVIVGTDDRLKHKALIGSDWSPEWQDLGGAFNSTPLAVSLVPGKVTVYGLGVDGVLLYRSYVIKEAVHKWVEATKDWFTAEGPLTLDYYGPTTTY